MNRRKLSMKRVNDGNFAKRPTEDKKKSQATVSNTQKKDKKDESKHWTYQPESQQANAFELEGL